MALICPQYGPNHVILHYLSVVLANLFSENEPFYKSQSKDRALMVRI